MSAKISTLPAVVGANIQDTDLIPVVATGITSRASISEIKNKLNTFAFANGQTVTSWPTFILNNSNKYNVKNFGAVGDGATHPLSAYFSTLALAQVVYPRATALTQEIDWAAAQKALDTIQAIGGEVIFPDGTYLLNESLLVGDNRHRTWDSTTAYVVGDRVWKDGAGGELFVCVLGNTNQPPVNATYWAATSFANVKYGIRGEGTVILKNTGIAGKHTFVSQGVTSSSVQQGIFFDNLILISSGTSGVHGFALRFIINSGFRNIICNMNGSAFYFDGGTFGLVWDTIQVWPAASRTYGSTGDGHTYSAWLFDTPAASAGGSGAGYAHFMSWKDININNGGRGIQLKSTFGGSWVWTIDSFMGEGLTGGAADGESNGSGWIFDIDSVRYVTIRGVYGEMNTVGTLGDANDKIANISGCVHVRMEGFHGTGKIVVRSTNGFTLENGTLNTFDADSSVSHCVVRNVKYDIAGTGGTFTNTSVDPIEENVGNGSGSVLRVLKLYQGLTLNRNAVGDLTNQFNGTVKSAGGLLVAVNANTTFFATASFLPGTYIWSLHNPNGADATYNATGLFIWNGAQGTFVITSAGVNITPNYVAGTGLRVNTAASKDIAWAVQRIQ